jgi:excisionase family DNA binding protein
MRFQPAIIVGRHTGRFMEGPVTARSKIGNLKPGTPRLPITKHAVLHRAAPNVAAKHPRATQPANDPTPEPVQHLNLGKERLLTVKEAAYRLGKNPGAVRAWLHCGRLSGWQPGGHGCSLMVSEASLEEMLILPVGFRK